MLRGQLNGYSHIPMISVRWMLMQKIQMYQTQQLSNHFQMEKEVKYLLFLSINRKLCNTFISRTRPVNKAFFFSVFLLIFRIQASGICKPHGNVNSMWALCGTCL